MRKTNIIGVVMMVLLSSIGFSSAGLPDYSSLEVTLLSQDPDPIKPAGWATLRFKINNIGVETAENIQFELLPNFPFSLYSGDALVDVGSLQGLQDGDDAYILKYQVRVHKDALEGSHEVNVRYKFDGSEWTTVGPFTVDVETQDAILSVTEITTTPKTVEPGEEFTLNVKMKNMADSLLEYLKTSITLVRRESTAAAITYTEYPFSPIGSTNEKTIRKLATNQETVVSFDLIADPDAEAGVYKVPLVLTYSDESGTNYTKENTFSLIIAQKPDLSVIMDSTTVREPGKKGEVTVKFVNKGLANIKFLNAKLNKNNAYELLSPDEVYVGNIDSDDYETAEFEIYVKPDAEGEMHFPVNVEYQDDNNRVYSEDYNLGVKLYSEAESLKYGITKKSNTTGYLIVIVIVVAGVFGYKKYKKGKKKKSK
ncbi:hypothetical protein HQ529_04500 [Candidatus Woesearchaeota archaeon]|nr:hypothetical protein [Candidatus Woesearchaeota archaeon]